MAFFSTAIELAVLPVELAVLPVVWPRPCAAADGVQPVSGLFPAGSGGCVVCASPGVPASNAATYTANMRIFILGLPLTGELTGANVR